MITGTHYFVSFTKACDYYKEQGLVEGTPAEIERAIRAKIEEGAIDIGQPEIKPGQKLLIIDNGTRYAIEE